MAQYYRFLKSNEQDIKFNKDFKGFFKSFNWKLYQMTIKGVEESMNYMILIF